LLKWAVDLTSFPNRVWERDLRAGYLVISFATSRHEVIPLGLGTNGGEALLHIEEIRKVSEAEGVPKQSLGTRFASRVPRYLVRNVPLGATR